LRIRWNVNGKTSWRKENQNWKEDKKQTVCKINKLLAGMRRETKKRSLDIEKKNWDSRKLK
jgi:hypothetical protein